MDTFEQFESNVRYYCRRWPVVFATSHGSTIFDEDSKAYLDFFAGAGVLSYGHNNPELVEVALSHLRSGKLLHSLDTFTVEKREFLSTFEELILKPRNMDMVVQTVGPTGATAVEAALQLAQRLTGKRAVLGFAGGYHGMSYRAASVSDSMAGRETVAHIGDFVALPFVRQMTNDDLDLLDRTLRAGVDGQKFGAILIEATQGEGGARAFDPAYLAALRSKATELGIMVIADEVQAADVVVSHHVVYNVPEIVPFIEALNSHARKRVVIEMPQQHPRASSNSAWKYFWNLDRPTAPTPQDLINVLKEMGIDAHLTLWNGKLPVEQNLEDAIRFMRIRLCLPANKDGEIEEFLGDNPPSEIRPLATIWWDIKK